MWGNDGRRHHRKKPALTQPLAFMTKNNFDYTEWRHSLVDRIKTFADLDKFVRASRKVANFSGGAVEVLDKSHEGCLNIDVLKNRIEDLRHGRNCAEHELKEI